MQFSYNWLQSYFDKKLPSPRKLASLLTVHSFEVDEPEKKGKDHLLNIDVLPNRAADCYSHLGIAKEIAVLLGYKIQDTSYKLQKDPKLQTEDYVRLEVEEPELCPRYMGLFVRGVKVAPSPKWLKEKLESVGQKSINNIVDIANYVMLETGQPIHAFDLDKIGKRKIIVRKGKSGEKIKTLDDNLVHLEKNMLLIADDKDPLAIAGIKGGKKAEITQKTKDIVIEAAVFDALSVRKTSRLINLKTDASVRFEHGVSMFLPEAAINRMAELVQEIAGGNVAQTPVDSCATKIKLPRIVFTDSDVLKLTGKEIDQGEISKILKSLGFEVKASGQEYRVVPPKERLDINIKEDVIEEVVRIYGYENIPSQLPAEVAVLPKKNEEYIYSNWIRGILSGLGFSEVNNYSFSKIGKVALKNPISSERTHLRTSLIPGLKNNVAENFKNFDEVKLFEIGKTFYLKEREITSVGVIIGRKKNTKDIGAELRGAADSLFLKDVEIKNNAFEIGLDLIIDAAKENGMDLSEFAELEPKDIEYKPFSKFPAIIRDVSLFVPPDTQIVEVMDVIENTAGELLLDTDLFDMYEPPGGDRKSLAFRLIFQSFGKTLTDKEVNQIMDKIISALEENIQWEVRKK